MGLLPRKAQPSLTMTTQTPKKIHQSRTNLGAIAILWGAGAVEALLLARLLARLLAARPDSPAISLLYAITWPLVAPLRALDYDQPPFGAALELSTLLLAICVPLLAGVAWLWIVRRNKPGGGSVEA
jgi:uncharacterized protein YggT (Ycf19 family)